MTDKTKEAQTSNVDAISSRKTNNMPPTNLSNLLFPSGESKREERREKRDHDVKERDLRDTYKRNSETDNRVNRSRGKPECEERRKVVDEIMLNDQWRIITVTGKKRRVKRKRVSRPVSLQLSWACFAITAWLLSGVCFGYNTHLFSSRIHSIFSFVIDLLMQMQCQQQHQLMSQRMSKGRQKGIKTRNRHLSQEDSRGEREKTEKEEDTWNLSGSIISCLSTWMQISLYFVAQFCLCLSLSLSS